MLSYFYFFFFNDTATTEIYTLSLHDALPIFYLRCQTQRVHLLLCGFAEHFGNLHADCVGSVFPGRRDNDPPITRRSEEHTSELQSRSDLVCRLLLEKKQETVEPLETTCMLRN